MKVHHSSLTILYAAMAQQVEHVLGKDEVTGSNPVSSSIKNFEKSRFFYFFKVHFYIKTEHILGWR